MLRSLFAALLLSGCSLSRIHHQRIEHRVGQQGFAPHTLELGETSVHYWKGGEGPPVMLLEQEGPPETCFWTRGTCRDLLLEQEGPPMTCFWSKRDSP